MCINYEYVVGLQQLKSRWKKLATLAGNQLWTLSINHKQKN